MFKTGNTFGADTKRGQAKITLEVKEKLITMTADVYKALERGIKNNEFPYIKLWFEYLHGKPTQQLDINQTSKIMNVEFHYTTKERNARIKELAKLSENGFNPNDSINSDNNL